MKASPVNKRILFDLNHPADFHFFKNLIVLLEDRGYGIKVVARDKDCLHELLRSKDIPFVSRGKGSHRLAGKYIFAIFNLLLLSWQIVRCRPGLTISLASPYLIHVSRFLRIRTLTYIDTDINPRIFRHIRKANYIFTPADFSFDFPENHFRLDTFKELAYLPCADPEVHKDPEGIFFRITRTDSVHHTRASRINIPGVVARINDLSGHYPVIVSSELSMLPNLDGHIRMADITAIHQEMDRCTAFWGNSATMAAEAAIMGVPAVFVGAEKFSYIGELEDLGWVYYFHPRDIELSWDKLNELMAQNASEDEFQKPRSGILKKKINPTHFLLWFIENLPDSAISMQNDPEVQRQFKC